MAFLEHCKPAVSDLSRLQRAVNFNLKLFRQSFGTGSTGGRLSPNHQETAYRFAGVHADTSLVYDQLLKSSLFHEAFEVLRLMRVPESLLQVEVIFSLYGQLAGE